MTAPPSLRLAANCSTLFTELPLDDRAGAAAAAGFAGVEFWWPWPDQPVPSDAAVDAFVAAVRAAGMSVVGLNLYAGDLTGPDAGVLSDPARAAEFRDSLAVSAHLAGALGVHGMNALYGVRRPGLRAEEQDALAAEHLTAAADVLGPLGTRVLLEPLSGRGSYPLKTAADVVEVLDRVGRPELGLLLDLYHLTANGDDVGAAVEAYADRVAHVQVADHCPLNPSKSRHEPGTGRIDFAGPLRALAEHGYDGWVALEYLPATTTAAGLAGAVEALRAVTRL